jgi:hypothetical protein
LWTKHWHCRQQHPLPYYPPAAAATSLKDAPLGALLRPHDILTLGLSVGVRAHPKHSQDCILDRLEPVAPLVTGLGVDVPELDALERTILVESDAMNGFEWPLPILRTPTCCAALGQSLS